MWELENLDYRRSPREQAAGYDHRQYRWGAHLLELCAPLDMTGSKDSDRVLGPVGGDDELRLIAHNDSRDARQA